MKFLANLTQKQYLLVALFFLAVGNLLVWGIRVVESVPSNPLYSTGTTFASDGTVLSLADKLEFKGDHVNYTLKIKWNDQNNSMQESGIATHGLRGELNIDIQKSSSFGPSILTALDLDDELFFSRAYMQHGHARVSLLSLPGEFKKKCYYFLFTKKIYCGSSK